MRWSPNRLLILMLLSSLPLLPLPAAAQDVDVDLVSGKVRGFIKGVGTAYVTARVTNNSDRPLLGVTISAYFSMISISFGEPDAKYFRYHKVFFRPPLPPGKSKIVKFTDSDGAGYVTLRIAKADLGPYPPNVWVGGVRVSSVPIGGRMFVAVKDVAAACAWTLSPGEHKGELAIKSGAGQITVYANGSAPRPGNALKSIERRGRAYVALADLSRASGLAISHTKELNRYELSAPGAQSTVTTDLAGSDMQGVLPHELPDSGPDWPRFEQVSGEDSPKADPEWLDYASKSTPLALTGKQIHVRGRLLQPPSNGTYRIAVGWMRLPSYDPIELDPPYLVIVRLSKGTRYFAASGKHTDASALRNATHIEAIGPKPKDRQPIDADVAVIYTSDAQ